MLIMTPLRSTYARPRKRRHYQHLLHLWAGWAGPTHLPAPGAVAAIQTGVLPDDQGRGARTDSLPGDVLRRQGDPGECPDPGWGVQRSRRRVRARIFRANHLGADGAQG